MLGAIFGLSILGFLIGVENRYLTLIQLFWYVFKKNNHAGRCTKVNQLQYLGFVFSHNLYNTMKEKEVSL